MAQTTYVNGTVVQPAWLNDVDTVTYGVVTGTRTLTQALSERVSVARYLPTGVTPQTATATQATTALQTAINSGAKRVYITADYTINSSISLAANQRIEFDGGSLTAAAGTVAANGILYANAKANVRIVDPIITATVSDSLSAINIVDSPNFKLDGGLFVGCNAALQSSSTSTRMGHKISNLIINLNGLLVTGLYTSAILGASFQGVEIFGGKEGFGVYNGCSYLKYSACDSSGHTQDGFVIINGNKITYSACQAKANTQSGFTTQRQTAGTNCFSISYVGCEAEGNSADGFDIRGSSTGSNWGVDMKTTLTGCVSNNNGGTGFFIVYAEGTQLAGCTASGNAFQGLQINNSPRVSVSGFQSFSNTSSGAITGTADAGILVTASTQVSLTNCISTNSAGATQAYGFSFTGACDDGSVSGGYYGNNITGFFNIDNLGQVAISNVPNLNIATNVWVNYINSPTGAGDYTGFGVPTFSAVKGSVFHRTDGGSGEIYVSNGGTSWTIR